MKKDIAMQLGEETAINSFKSMRLATGMSQIKFCEYINIPKNTLASWEQGIRVPPDYVLELIEFKLRAEGYLPKK